MKVIELHDSYLDDSVIEGTSLILNFDTLVCFPLNQIGKAILKETTYHSGKIILSNCKNPKLILEGDIFDGSLIVNGEAKRLLSLKDNYMGLIEFKISNAQGDFTFECDSLRIVLVD